MVDRTKWIVGKCINKKVLHVGCCDTPLMIKEIKANNLLHFKLLNVAKELDGIDISKDDIELLENIYKVPNLVCGDCEKITDYFPNDKFEVVVAGELLEHLNNPGLFLTSLKELLTPESLLIISVPNGVAFRRGVNSLLRRETVHSGHNFYFSKKTIVNFLARKGYEVLEIHGFRVINKRTLAAYISDSFASFFSEFACEGIALAAKVKDKIKNYGNMIQKKRD